MKREELEHVLRAASRLVKQRDFLVIGSAAILGTYSENVLPRAASRSEEADLAPFNDPTGEKSAAIEGSLGQLSSFHEMYGYYADGVGFCCLSLKHSLRVLIRVLEVGQVLGPEDRFGADGRVL